MLLVALLLGVSSCVYSLDEKWQEPQPQIPDDALVSLTFGVPAEPSTKAFGVNPTISSMHIFLFDEAGLLLAAKSATAFGAVTENGSAHTSYWTVDLPMGAGERRLHFVANLGADYVPPASGSEVSVMRSLTTTGGVDAYWQRRVISGITAYKYDGSGSYTYVNPANGEEQTIPVESVPGFRSKSGTTYTYQYVDIEGETRTMTVNQGDYITRTGTKSLDGTGLFASKATTDAVRNIPLVRNFARIKISSDAQSNFQLEKAVLINTPISGFVVPYDDRSGQNKFSSVYMDAGTTVPTFDNVFASGYPGSMPGDGVNTVMPAESAAQSVSGGEVTMFMYERGIPTQNASAILVYGQLYVNNVNKGKRWFKIDITNDNGEYVPIYRDCIYDMKIKSINGSEGYGSLEDAFGASSLGDITSSPETATLTRVDDGKGLQLWVEYIDYTSTSTSTTQVRLLYKFTYNNSNLNGNVTMDVRGYTGTDPAVTGVTISTANYTGTDTPDSSTGWRQATVTLDGVGQNLKRSYIHVEGTRNYKTLSRDVTFRVLPKQNFTLVATPVSDEANQQTTLTITLPPNVLGYSVFPLTLMIEAKNNCLTPVDNLTVETGKSAFDSNRNTFYFLKTISYSEYQANNVFQCRFKTTKTSGNVPTQIRVTDKRNLFNPGTVDLTAQ